MKKQSIGFLSLTFAGLAFGGPTMTSAPFDLDTAPGTVVYAPCHINYSPTWIDGVDADGANVAIYAVACAGQEQPVTSLVYRAAADAKGVYAYTPGEEAPETVRLVMSVEKGAAVLGTLVQDVAFGTTATLGGVSADSRANALQEVADATGGVPIAYDVAWQEGAVSALIQCVRRTREKYGPVVVTTNDIATVAHNGVHQWTVPNEDGFNQLLVTMKDASGDPVGETLASAWFEKCVPRGFLLMFR